MLLFFTPVVFNNILGYELLSEIQGIHDFPIIK